MKHGRSGSAAAWMYFVAKRSTDVSAKAVSYLCQLGWDDLLYPCCFDEV